MCALELHLYDSPHQTPVGPSELWSVVPIRARNRDCLKAPELTSAAAAATIACDEFDEEIPCSDCGGSEKSQCAY